MANSIRTAQRTGIAQYLIDQLGAGAKIKRYNGTPPATAETALSGNTLLATAVAGATIGTASAGAIDFDEAGLTQNNTLHVSGTPTFVDLTTSADVVIVRGLVGFGWTVSSPVVNGVDVTHTALSITVGNV